MRASALRMISFGCWRITVIAGVFSMRFSDAMRLKVGDSSTPSRIQSPTPISTTDIRKGMRQPQVRNASPDHALKASTARLAVNSPAGTPIWGQDAARPRLVLLPAHSMDISTDPPHSPPTPTPWMKRSAVRMIAPQMPIVA